MSALVWVTGLRVVYGATPVVDGIDLTVERGEWLAVVGPNGAGKTTLLRSLAGLTAYAGTVVVDGAVMGTTSRRAGARRVALVPQTPRVPPGMSVADYVLLGRTPHIGYLDVERHADLAVISRLAIRLELGGLLHRRLDSLSGGELQRTLLARALAQEAPVLLLDEPTAALDIGRRHDVLEAVDEVRRERDVTVISATHDLTAAAQFAGRVIMLAAGRVVSEGAPRAVLTAQSIEDHYGAAVTVVEHDGSIAVLPKMRRRTTPEQGQVMEASTSDPTR